MLVPAVVTIAGTSVDCAAVSAATALTFSVFAHCPQHGEVLPLKAITYAAVSLSLAALLVAFVLQDKFITQLAPDIQRKLQELGMGSSTPLANILTTANVVFYYWDQEEEEKTLTKDNTRMRGSNNCWLHHRGTSRSRENPIQGSGQGQPQNGFPDNCRQCGSMGTGRSVP